MLHRGRRAASSNRDPYWANVSAYLKMNGADTSTTITDETGNDTYTAAGTAQIDTAQSPPDGGGSSLLLDGNSDYVTNDTASTALFDISSGNWTGECFMRAASFPANNQVPLHIGYTTGLNGVNFNIVVTADLLRVDNGLAASGIAGTTALVVNTWYHLAVVNDGGTWRIYLDGVQEDSGAAQSLPAGTHLKIGDITGATGFVDGWISHVRITKGVCRYPDGTTFTVPSLPYPTS